MKNKTRDPHMARFYRDPYAKTKTDKIRLYRDLLRKLKGWPSTRREAVTIEVKNTWHACANVTDEEKARQMVLDAEFGLEQLQKYDVPKGGTMVI